MPTLSVAPALVDLGVGLVATARDIDDFSLDVGGGFNLAVKLMIGLLLLGIALDVRVEDLRSALRHPRVFVAVTAAQFVLVPLLTLGLVATLDLPPSVALGMLLVVSGPAGSMSNLLTHRARGDVALSVSLTTVSSSMAALVTPLALAFWAGLSPQASQVLDAVDLSPVEVLVEGREEHIIAGLGHCRESPGAIGDRVDEAPDRVDAGSGGEPAVALEFEVATVEDLLEVPGDRHRQGGLVKVDALAHQGEPAPGDHRARGGGAAPAR